MTALQIASPAVAHVGQESRLVSGVAAHSHSE